MEFFKDKILTVGEWERTLLAQVIKEARDSFSCALDDPYLEQLHRKERTPFGCEQMIKIYLEQLIIQLYRTHFKQYDHESHKKEHITDSMMIYDSIIKYFEKTFAASLR